MNINKLALIHSTWFNWAFLIKRKKKLIISYYPIFANQLKNQKILINLVIKQLIVGLVPFLQKIILTQKKF